MSLYTPADGLLGTHVSWREVEERMQKALDTSATFGDLKKATNISDLKGFMSRIALVEPDWKGALENEKLPDKFVVKISSQLALIELTKLMDFGGENFWEESRLNEMGQITRLLHNREVETYKLLMQENNPLIPFTKIYALEPFTEENNLKAYIISEYIPNLHHIGMHETIPAEDLIPVVRAVAAFSAIGEKVSEEQTKYARGADFLDIVFGQFLDEKTSLRTEEMMRKSFPEEYSEKVEKMLAINKKYYRNREMLPNIKNTCEFFGYRPVFIHSDLWSSNFLCTKDGEKVNLKAIIDYQTVSFATPAQDVGRLLVSCLSRTDRREKADMLLEEYYKTFVEQLNGAQVPYTLQQLKDSYQVYYPLMTLMVLPGIAPLMEHSQIAEEMRAKVAEMAMDKMVGLLEDVISYHESSIKKFPKYFEF